MKRNVSENLSVVSREAGEFAQDIIVSIKAGYGEVADGARDSYGSARKAVAGAMRDDPAESWARLREQARDIYDDVKDFMEREL